MSDYMKNALDIICIGAIGIDTNVYLVSEEINFNVEMNFSENIDSIGQAGGYSCLVMNQLGLNTGFIGYVGDDYQGKYIKEFFKSKKISTLWFTDLQGTKRSINFMNTLGERKNFYDGKGSMNATPDLEKCTKFLSQTKVVHINIVNWSRKLFTVAKKLGLKISCDIQDVENLNDSYRSDFIIASEFCFYLQLIFQI